ncbi:MAG: 2-dehydropantoate 2-reductase [Anaerolineaceae bacterium]|nr:2-dehydropantoate 2-reductase [Anaerolineaceae bacterium]
MAKESQTKFRFLCFGVGAVGIYLGGSLHREGHDVVFVDRPENSDLVRERGLILHLEEGDVYHAEHPDVYPSIEEALQHGPFDAAIFAVKGYDTQRVLKYLRPYQVALPAFFSIQNGIGNEAQLVEVLGPDKVIPMVITSSIRKIGLGEIELRHKRGIGVGMTKHQLYPALVNSLRDANLGIRQYRFSASMKWSKLIINLITNATAAILQMTPAEIISDPELRDVEFEVLKEGLRVMDSRAVHLVTLPGFPLGWLRLLMLATPSRLFKIAFSKLVTENWGDELPLLAIDAKRGKTESEVETINGAIVHYGLQSGIPTPYNQIITDTLLKIVTGKIDPETFNHNKEAYLALFEPSAENES